MYGDLCLDLELHSRSGILKYIRKKEEVLIAFIQQKVVRNTLYRQMVYWIRAHRTWIDVADDNLFKEHVIARKERTDYLVSRTLVLWHTSQTELVQQERLGISRSMIRTGHWPHCASRTDSSSLSKTCSCIHCLYCQVFPKPQAKANEKSL